MASYVLNIWRPIRVQTITLGAASAELTNAIGDSVFAVRLSTDLGAYHTLPAKSPGAASATDLYLPPNGERFMEMRQGEKIAALQFGTGGFLKVEELTK